MVLVGILYYVSFRCISTLSSFRHGEVRIPRFLSGASKITLNIFKLFKLFILQLFFHKSGTENIDENVVADEDDKPCD